MTTRRPLIVTMGDPAGVGPEIIAKAWPILSTPPGPLAPVTPFAVIGDADVLAAQGAPVEQIFGPSEAAGVFGRAIPVLHHPTPAPVTPGQPDPRNAVAVADWIERAVDLTLSGEASGIVTAPIAKAPMYAVGLPLPRPHRVHRRTDRRHAVQRHARPGHDADGQGPARLPGDHPRRHRPGCPSL